MWKFDVYRDARRQFRWRLKASNGRIVADSGEGYSDRYGARRPAETVRRNIGNAGIEEI